MRITFLVGEAEIDVELAVRGSDQTVADVVMALADGPVAGGVGLVVDGRFISPTATLGESGLREGAVGSDDKGDKGVAGPVGLRGVGSFNRPPRRMPPAAPGPVHLPAAPPEPRSGSRFGWATLLAPLIMGGVMAVMWDPRLALFAL